MKQLLLIFNTDNVKLQQKIVVKYNEIREGECYCGHTITCDCGNPGISEFKSALQTNSIDEEILKKILFI